MTLETLTATDLLGYAEKYARAVSGNFINGEWTTSTSTETFEVHNPSTGAILGTTPIASREDVDLAVRTAVAAQRDWARLTPADRAASLYKFADLVEEHFEHFVALEAVDAGKPVTAVRSFELPDIIGSIRYFIGAARVLSAPAGLDYLEGVSSVMRREPVGVVAGITPWNYPLLQAVAKIVPALATGNAVVAKPAETTPYSTALLAELAAEVLPAGLFNVVFGTGPITGDALSRHEDVDMVSFTGSVETGRKVGAAAADGVKKTVMELGGNSPVLIFADADLEDALDVISEAGLYNSGQDCMAASRLLVHASIAEEVVEGLAKRASSVVQGDALDIGTTMGPLNSYQQRARVASKVSAVGSHARVVIGGNESDGEGYFFEPTIVANVRQDDELVFEEVFGPVFTVQTFQTESEALDLANGTRYGLAASVFTTDLATATKVQNALNFGTVWVNNHLIFGADLPVSGFKASGVGVENGEAGIAEFTRLKHVMIDPRR